MKQPLVKQNFCNILKNSIGTQLFISLFPVKTPITVVFTLKIALKIILE